MKQASLLSSSCYIVTVLSGAGICSNLCLVFRDQLLPSIGNQCAAGLIAAQQEPTLQLQMALEIANGTVEYDLRLQRTNCGFVWRQR